MRQEEVAVFFVVSCVNLERSKLFSSFRTHALVGRFLLRQHRLQLKLAKLHVGSDTKERRCALHQRIVGRERHVAAFHKFYYFVFLAFIAQLEVLRIEVECGIGVVVKVHVHLVAHLSVHIQIYLLVEVHRCHLAVSDGQRWVVDVLQRSTKAQFGCSLCSYTDASGTEYLLCRAECEVHIREVELLFTFLF